MNQELRDRAAWHLQCLRSEVPDMANVHGIALHFRRSFPFWEELTAEELLPVLEEMVNEGLLSRHGTAFRWEGGS